MRRSISHTEIAASQTCQARWDLRYGGRLAGDALKPLLRAPILREGSAWGAAVAAWHAQPEQLSVAPYLALAQTIREDVAVIQEAGLPFDLADSIEMQDRLTAMFDHYVAIVPKLANLTRLEGEVDVPLPSRSSARASNRYRYVAFFDGLTTDVNGHRWIVEFKLRGQLTPVHLLQIMPQHRWYAWAWQQESGEQIAGVLIDERLNDVPEEPQLLKSGKVSQAAAQRTTPELYAAACERTGTPVKPELVELFGRRVWGQVVPLLFRPSELEEAGRELVSASKLIRDLDSGELWPTRNVSRPHCNGCAYRQICPAPGDRLLVDSQFERRPPKRLRDLEVIA